MDCFMLLKQDHDEVTELLQQCQAAAEENEGEEVFKTLARNIAVHAKAEETLFYPRLREWEELSALLEESYKEHQAVENLLEEMSQMSPDDEEWTAKLKELEQNIAHHVEEEEGQLFPKASKLMSKDEAVELGETLAEEKKEMMKGSNRAAKEVFTRLGL